MHDYVTETFLLVSSSVSSKQQLCIVHGQDRKTEQKKYVCRIKELSRVS